MPSQDTARIPLRARDGSVRTYAIVDAADADWVNQWRWSLNTVLGYAYRTVQVDGHRASVYLHRELLGLVRGDGLEGDHIDRNRLNNRRSNLRVLTKSTNRHNVSSSIGFSSKYRGVCWAKQYGKWLANVTVGGKYHNLGLFADEEAAAEVARSARRILLPYSTD